MDDGFEIQALGPPDGHLIKSSQIIHGHIKPSFGRLTINTNTKEASSHYSTQHSQVLNTDYTRQWSKNIKITVDMAQLPTRGLTQIVQPPTSSTMAIRLAIESNVNRPFPKAHSIVLTSYDDVFFHWKFECTPFSFSTLVTRMGWELPQTAGDPMEEAFEKFGYMVKGIAHHCGMRQTKHRFKAVLSINSSRDVGTIEFSEIVKGYRKVQLLVLDFSPSDWEAVKRDVSSDYKHLKAEYDLVKDDLVQVLDTIAVHQPAILLSKNVNNHIHHNEYIPQMNNLEESDTESPDNNVIFTKTIPVTINNRVLKTEKDHKLSFTFYANGMKGMVPESYKIVATDPDDMFFSFTSIAITPDRFAQLTTHISVMEQTKQTNYSQISRTMGGFVPVPSTKQGKVPFTTSNGIGGILGVFGNDYMEGVNQEPERYFVNLHRFKAYVELKSCKPPVQNNTNRAYPTEPALDFPMVTLNHDKRQLPEAMELSLSFTERVLYRTSTTIALPFAETDSKTVRASMRFQHIDIKRQVANCQEHLDALMREVGSKNKVLFGMLNHAVASRTKTLRNMDEVDEQKKILASDEESFENRYMHQLIPSRNVHQMMIPVEYIQPVKYTKNISGGLVIASCNKANRVQQSTSERYKAQYMYK